MRDNAKRVERYKLLRDLGYSPKAAARLRDLKSERIERSIRQRKEDLDSIPIRDRTVEDVQRIRKFSVVQTRNNPRILKKREKLDLWKLWSSKSGNFPANLRRKIRDENAKAGKDPFDKFGFRVTYFEYVENFQDVDAGMLQRQGSP